MIGEAFLSNRQCIPPLEVTIVQKGPVPPILMGPGAVELCLVLFMSHFLESLATDSCKDYIVIVALELIVWLTLSLSIVQDS